MDLPPVPFIMVSTKLAKEILEVNKWRRRITYVVVGEVTTLEHELRDDTVELAASVAEALLAGAESAEVLGGLSMVVSRELAA